MSTQQRPVPPFGAISHVLTKTNRVHLARKSNNGLVRLLCTGAFEREERVCQDAVTCRKCQRIEGNLS